ncbi:MAG TPA: hypothetical protein VM619_12600 [Luteimonas sp.]|nr:hypothetical protein [Luteimonas sp.]
MRGITLSSFLLPVLLACAGAARADGVRTLRAGDTQLEVAVIGVDDPARTALLQDWIAEAARAPLTVAGRFPLRSARVEIRQVRSDDDSPVPWGQTARDSGVRVLLYVREDATLDQLRHDWTAVHELSHLFHPHLGERGRWLAEGLASYYQDALRARIGLIAPEDAWARLDGGFRRGQRAAARGPLQDLGHRRGATMRVYWAGAAYWLEADLALRARGRSLDAVLGEYARCCLRGTGETAPADFVAALDRIAGDDTFSGLYARDAVSTAFPPIDDAYRRLGIARDGDRLRFSRDRHARALRAAIMGRRPNAGGAGAHAR